MKTIRRQKWHRKEDTHQCSHGYNGKLISCAFIPRGDRISDPAGGWNYPSDISDRARELGFNYGPESESAKGISQVWRIIDLPLTKREKLSANRAALKARQEAKVAKVKEAARLKAEKEAAAEREAAKSRDFAALSQPAKRAVDYLRKNQGPIDRAFMIGLVEALTGERIGGVI